MRSGRRSGGYRRHRQADLVGQIRTRGWGSPGNRRRAESHARTWPAAPLIGFQDCTHPSERPRQAHANGSLSHPKGTGELRVLEAVHVAQHDERALSLFERRECIFETRTIGDEVDTKRRFVDVVVRLTCVVEERGTPERAKVIDAPMSGNSEEPRAHLRLAAEGRQCNKRRAEHLLSEILGGRAVAHDGGARGEDAAEVLTDEILSGTRELSPRDPLPDRRFFFDIVQTASQNGRIRRPPGGVCHCAGVAFLQLLDLADLWAHQTIPG